MRRAVGFFIGLAYSLSLGFFLMMLTGGGHGNFTWIVFFFLTSMFGILYPALGLLAANTRTLLAKAAMAAFLILNGFLVLFFFADGMIRANSSPMDNISLRETPVLAAVLALLLVGPQIVCLVILGRQLLRYGLTENE
jgi:hypothetical protein